VTSPAATLHTELTTGLDRATAAGDRGAFTAALIEAIGRSGGDARDIVIYASRRAPAYAPAAVSAAIQAFPGLRSEIMAGMAALGPADAASARQLAEAPARVDVVATAGAASAPQQQPATPSLGLRDFTIVLGMGVGLVPDYEGHDQHEVVPIPLIDIEWRDTVFLSSTRGLGTNLFNTDRFKVGVSATYRFGRDEDESERLTGAGDIDDAIEFGAFGELHWRAFRFRGDIRQDIVDAHGGTIVELAVGIREKPSPKDLLEVEVVAHWASDSYMQTYFGVNASQTNGGTRGQLTTAAAFKDAGVVMNWTHQPIPGTPWFGQLRVSWARLLGDAVTSPLTDDESENQFGAGLILGYRF
jgi:MipA family protein